MTIETRTPRTPTAVDAVADAYVDKVVALSPIEATFMGIPGHDGELDDFSHAGHEAHAALRRETLAALERARPLDDVDRVTVATLRDRLGLADERYVAGLDESDLNVIASPFQGIRDVFDLMRTDSQEDWSVIATRMRQVPRALTQYLDVLRDSADAGRVAPRRQVVKCIQQGRDLVADDGYFATLVRDARAGGDDLGPAVASDLATAVAGARAAYASAADRLATELLDRAPTADGIGRDLYPLCSRYFVGASVDLEETYAWGQEELARITREMEDVARAIRPGATVKEAIALLDEDPAYRLDGTDALQRWMQDRADEAVAALGGTHFDIDGPMRTIECRIAPTQTGGIYYTAPSEDFSRPGRMWWSVPKGVTRFGTWRELTTVYHEGVPGHHLQIARAILRRDVLNRYRRTMVWCSGHGEGWALYAERLMGELGYMDDPGNRMGLLDGQAMRAARVVIDIGVHCGFDAPAEVGGGAWTYDKAWQLFTDHVNESEAMMRFELDRYLGWPGQAPSYKIGERLWLQLREEARVAAGAAWDPRAFHAKALDVGSVPLDVLRGAVLGTM